MVSITRYHSYRNDKGSGRIRRDGVGLFGGGGDVEEECGGSGGGSGGGGDARDCCGGGLLSGGGDAGVRDGGG